jgi:hypothetical protein
VALLDPDACFPAAAFCSTAAAAAAENVLQDGSDDDGDDAFSSLAALQQLGMRSSADLGTLVLAARYVEKTAREGDEDMSVARGKVGKQADGRVGCALWCI